MARMSRAVRGLVARFCLVLLWFAPLNGQSSPFLSPLTQKYVRINSHRVVLSHVRVIDGTGNPAAEDRNVVIEAGKIAAVMPGADVQMTDGVVALDLRDYTVMPGIVGM